MHDGFETIPGSNVEAAVLALQAAAAVPMPDVPFVHVEISGTILVYGRDDIAIEAGNCSSRISTSPCLSRLPAWSPNSG